MRRIRIDTGQGAGQGSRGRSFAALAVALALLTACGREPVQPELDLREASDDCADRGYEIGTADYASCVQKNVETTRHLRNAELDRDLARRRR